MSKYFQHLLVLTATVIISYEVAAQSDSVVTQCLTNCDTPDEEVKITQACETQFPELYKDTETVNARNAALVECKDTLKTACKNSCNELREMLNKKYEETAAKKAKEGITAKTKFFGANGGAAIGAAAKENTVPQQ